MNIKQIIEEKLGHAVSDLAGMPSVRPSRVFLITYSTSGEIAVIHVSACDTAVYFEGLHCPFEDCTLLVDRAVAIDWGLMPREACSR
ncbi:MAG: hypothetical protein QOI34_959 [Verrucomicrobiota bacterium]|jgi:hypothetical protein